jgi:acetyl-CoA C-acetyltransferase
MKSEIVICGAARTPLGGFQGELSSLPAPELGAAAIKAALERSNIGGEDVAEVFMGCVLPAGQGQAPARQASLGAGMPKSVPATTINKMCGSGMQTVMMAFDALHARPNSIFVAGGMESMSNAPYLLPKVRAGLRLGHGQVIDHMFLDGLEDAYDKGRLMGTFAEDAAQHYQFTRAAQDEYAVASLTRAKKAGKDSSFDGEIAPVTIKTKSGPAEIRLDEQPAKADVTKIPQLKPAFRPNGTVTAANSSSISDGAAALVIATVAEAERRNLNARWRIVAVARHADEPALFTSAPVEAIRRVLQQANWTKANVDLWEINEAFAVVPMIAMKELGLPHEAVNVHGGACALGHPIGASGARIIVTLVSALERHKLDRGVAAICIGGGEATAIAVERL